MWYFASGDSGFYFPEQLRSLSWLPEFWRADVGMGISTLSRMWFDYPFTLMLKLLSSLGLQWAAIEKILWILCFVIGAWSIMYLSKNVLHTKLQKITSAIIYCCNTYILLVFGGGQIGVAFGYSFAPFVLARIIYSVQDVIEQNVPIRRRIKNALINGLSFALLIAFDLRFAYLTMLVGGVYLLVRLLVMGKKSIGYILPAALYTFVIPSAIAFVVHLFWILPIIKTGWGTMELGEQYTGTNILKDLSFADLAHSISLLHPNWPENLFGRVYFLQPEFLLIPILAFSSLLVAVVKKQRFSILYFACISLLGAFFAKGMQPPFQGVYQWLYLHIPGFEMFRDPTKFYVYIAMGYAVLIPVFLFALSKKLKSPWATYAVFIIFWAFTTRQLVMGQLTGQFRLKTIPQEYVTLKNMIAYDMTPYRTLWMPVTEKFAFASALHPVITASTLFNNANAPILTGIIPKPEFQQTIQAMGIKYIIVPQDVEHRIFLDDYKYDDSQRQQLITALETAGYKRQSAYQSVAVFENDQFLFQATTPANLQVQTYWSNVGLIAGALLICISVLLLFFLP